MINPQVGGRRKERFSFSVKKILESKKSTSSPKVRNTSQFSQRIALIAYQNRRKIQNSIFFRRNPVLSEQNVQLSKIR